MRHKLNFEQRQEAEGLIQSIMDDPEPAACELIYLRARVEELERIDSSSYKKRSGGILARIIHGRTPLNSSKTEAKESDQDMSALEILLKHSPSRLQTEAIEEFKGLRARVAELETLLVIADRAIGDHNAPADCYATGPMTCDPIQDLVSCPACDYLNARKG